MPREKKTPCTLVTCCEKEDFCCDFVNEQFYLLVESLTTTFTDALAALSVDCDQCRLKKLFKSFERVYHKAVEAYRVVLDSDCAQFCCESAAVAIGKVSQAFFSLIVTAILNRCLECEVSDGNSTEALGEEAPRQMSQLSLFIEEQLENLEKALELILSTVVCPKRKEGDESDESSEDEGEVVELQFKQPESKKYPRQQENDESEEEYVEEEESEDEEKEEEKKESEKEEKPHPRKSKHHKKSSHHGCGCKKDSSDSEEEKKEPKPCFRKSEHHKKHSSCRCEGEKCGYEENSSDDEQVKSENSEDEHEEDRYSHPVQTVYEGGGMTRYYNF